MQLIDISYFTGDTYLPGRGDLVVSGIITQTIMQRQPEYLKLILGPDLYAAFDAGLLVDPIPQRWKDLRDGANYNYRGVNHRWNGFVNAEFRSPIANYTYYWYKRGNASVSTGTGEVVPSTENGTRLSNAYKSTTVWNAMVKMNVDLYLFLLTNADIYPEWNNEYYTARGCFRGGLFGTSPLGDLFTTINPHSL